MNNPELLRPHLERLLLRFDRSFLEPDPLAAALPYGGNRHDFETAALIAALFAYGRASLIQKTVTAILCSMGDSPSRFCREFISSRQRGWQKQFVYRFQTRPDLVALVRAIGRAQRDHGGLRELFGEEDDPLSPDYTDTLTRFMATLRRYARRGGVRSFDHLLPDPARGGASKRLHLFLRWMIRREGVDPGAWADHFSAGRLLIPLDTHVARIARLLGLLTRTSDDLKAVREVTQRLRQFDPDDPVKYDFALCSFGKLGYCVKTINRDRCEECDMNAVCRWYAGVR